MRFSTIFTVLAAGVMAFAGAVPEIVAKRSNEDITGAFNTLRSQCNDIFPKFTNCDNDQCTKEITVEIVAAVNVCTATLNNHPGGIANLEVANLIVEVVAEIAAALDLHVNTCGSECPGAIDIFADVDLSLSLCLQVVLKLCIGLISLLPDLFVNLAVTLKLLCFNLVLNACVFISL